jgi:hypothetical protein
VDPCVVFDATWSYDVTVSDVLLFYLDAGSRSTLQCRVQRDLYAVEYELHDYGQPVVLDRVIRLPLRYQVLASDETGNPLEDSGENIGLISNPYPYLASSHAALSLNAVDVIGSYTLTVLYYELDDMVTLSLSGSQVVGVYEMPVIVRDGDDAVTLNLDGSSVIGSYISVILSESVEESVMLGVEGSFSVGAYVLVILYPGTDEHVVTLGLSGTSAGGSYDSV